MKYKSTAVWNQANDMFLVSDKGAIKPDSDFQGFEGMAASITYDTAKFILANRDSFEKAVALAETKRKDVELSKEVKNLVAAQVALGIPEAQAVENSVAIIKQRQSA